MDKYSLNGTWEFRMVDAGEWNSSADRAYPVPEDWIPAKVPGSMYQTYLEAGVIEDPYYRDNELKALPLSEQDYEYRISLHRLVASASIQLFIFLPDIFHRGMQDSGEGGFAGMLGDAGGKVCG